MDKNLTVKFSNTFFNTCLVIVCFSLFGCGGGSGDATPNKHESTLITSHDPNLIQSLASPVGGDISKSSLSTPTKLSTVSADNAPSLSIDIIKAAYDLLYAISAEIDVLHSANYSGNYSGPVKFKDPTLNSAVHIALGLPDTSVITTDNLKTLTSLQVTGSVTSLDGLQFAINLNEFLMYTNNGPVATYTDLKPLASLIHLKKLLLITGSFINVDALKGLPLENVEFFDLAYLADLEGLRGNSTLKHLGVYRSPVSKIAALKDVNFAVGADVIFEATCAGFTKDSETLDVVTTLQAKGVKTTYYVGLNEKVGEVVCPADVLNVAPEPIVKNPNFSVTAKYNSSGTLRIEWSTTDPLYVGLINTCEIYPELDFQLPRIPFKTISNCAATSFVEITDMPFVGTNITVLMKSTAVPENVLKAKAAIDNSLIAANLPVIRAMDWGQAVVTSNPKLVQSREALFRVHVTANSPKPVPEVWVALALNGQTKTLVMEKPATLPATKIYSNLAYSYSTIIPKEWMKPGLSISVSLNSTVKIITPTFADPVILYMTIVPTKVMGLDVSIPDYAQIQNDLKSTWPLSDIKLRTRVGFTSRVTQSANLFDLLNELRDLHTVDQDNGLYYGYFSHNVDNAPFGGLGDKPGRDAIGMDTDNANLMPHEVGHNFNLGHVNCGNPQGVDTAYPYNTNSMGSFAIDFGLKTFFQPNAYADVMSYCPPKHVSDYSYNTVQDYISRNPLKSFSNNDATLFKKPTNEKSSSIFVSGVIDVLDKVTLRRVLPLTVNPKKIPVGDYQLKVTAQNGNEYLYGVELPEVDHPSPKQPQYFSAIIPYIDLASVALIHNGNIIYTESAPQTNVTVQQKPSMPPVVEERINEVCLHQPTNGTGATLIHQGTTLTTLFMDTTDENTCVSSVGLENGGSWKIVLRKSIAIQEFVQAR